MGHLQEATRSSCGSSSLVRLFYGKALFLIGNFTSMLFQSQLGMKIYMHFEDLREEHRREMEEMNYEEGG